jgi:hypothetical protein
LTAVHIAVGIAVMATSLAAGAWGAWAWWRGDTPPSFWTLLRTSQVVLAVQVALGAVLLVLGKDPARLHVLYGVLPLAVSFVAEQLRLVSADQVLQRRGMDSAREMEALPQDEQREIVVDIVRREMGVMAASALVVFLLAVRASGVAGLFPL